MSGECDRCSEHAMDCRCNVPMTNPHDNEIHLRYGFCLLPYYQIPDLPEEEKVNHPNHYQGNTLEVIDIIEDFGLNFHLGNAIKYILRAGKKGDRNEDLRKAIWYIEREMTND